jgi:hypothetical protein
MIEVGLDGTIYNYHSHRKDSFIMATDQFIGRNISAAAANVVLFAIREAAEKAFRPDINIQ